MYVVWNAIDVVTRCPLDGVNDVTFSSATFAEHPDWFEGHTRRDPADSVAVLGGRDGSGHMGSVPGARFYLAAPVVRSRSVSGDVVSRDPIAGVEWVSIAGVGGTAGIAVIGDERIADEVISIRNWVTLVL